MAKQITLPQLQATSERVKSYVDNHATANVIKTKTLIKDRSVWVPLRSDSTTGVPAGTAVNYTGEWSSSSSTYVTLWGAAGTQNSVDVTQDMTDFDEIEVELFIGSRGASSDPWNYWGNETVIYPTRLMTESVYGNGAAMIGHSLFSVNPSAAIGVGAISNTRLGFRWRAIENNISPQVLYDMAVSRVWGIKYSTPVEYTTSEKVIGTYLGKTLYEKTLTNINVGGGTYATPTVVSLAAYGIEPTYSIIEYEGTITFDTGLKNFLPFIDGNTDSSKTLQINIYYNTSLPNWVINNTTQRQATVKGLTLRYVKETL